MVTWSILNLGAPFISLERLKLESWNFVCKVRYISFSLTMTTYPQMSVVRVTWPIFWGRLFVKQFALFHQTTVCLSCLSVMLVYCGQTVGWIKMPLGIKVGLGPCHIVLDQDPAPLSQTGTAPPIFGPYLLWPNSWMAHDATVWRQGLA